MIGKYKGEIVHVHIRTCPAVKKKVERLARLENRSVTNWLETVIDERYALSGLPPIPDDSREEDETGSA